MSTALPILVVNGPNLNLLGTREPAVYGASSLTDVERLCVQAAAPFGRFVEFAQSNHEGELIDRIQLARTTASALIVNAGGLSHTSVSLRDAVTAAGLPMIEVHVSNIHRRDEFRHHSYLSGVALGVIVGLGVDGYRLAIEFLCRRLDDEVPA